MSQVIHRYVMDVGETVRITGFVQVCAVAAVTDDQVEFWVLREDEYAFPKSDFFVTGTGHPIPDGSTWAATAPRSPGGYVWHLLWFGVV